MRILLLTDMPPCTNHTSGLVVNKWCDFFLEEGHEIFCALVKDPTVDVKIPQDKINRISFLNIVKPKEYWKYGKQSRIYNFLGKVRSFYHNNYSRLFVLPKISNQISKFAIDNKVDIIFASIQGQTITQLVLPVSKKSNIEYVAQTWDPLEWWLSDFGFDKITTKINMKQFGKVLKNAKTFMAMSWAMAIEYNKLYKANCVTNLPGLEFNKKELNYLDNKNKVFTISFAGQMYAKDELNLLIDALRKMNWKCEGKEVVLNLYGHSFNLNILSSDNIKIHGFIKQDELVTTLQKSNLLYCPYWFDMKYYKPCKLSFPGKLTTYLKTGVPILMHAPEHSSPKILLKNFNAAYFCNSLDIDEMCNTLKQVITDNSETRKTIVNNGFEVFQKFLTYDVMKKSLLVSFGLIDKANNGELEAIKKLYL